MTLVELLVVLVLLGLLASIGALKLTVFRSAEDSGEAALRRATRRAVHERRAVVLRTDSLWIRVLPDGRILTARAHPAGEVAHAP